MTSKLNRSIAILDVGHGNSTVVIEDNGVLVVDAGPKNALLEFLREQNVKHVDVLLISHTDQDHLGALAQLIASQEFTVGRIALNSDAYKTSDTWNDVIYELDQAEWREELRFDVALVPEDEPVFDGGNMRAVILGPSRYLAGIGPGGVNREGHKITSNSISAVIGLAVEGTLMVLLPGDIDEIGVDDLLAHNKTINTSILVFPHHGGKPGTANIAGYVGKLCDAVDPQVVVFSTGRGLYGTPNRDVVTEILKKLPLVHIMCTQLSEHCSDMLPNTNQVHLNDVFCSGREHGQCCAGTILIDLNDAGKVHPSVEKHQTFINSSVKKPICF
jgi:beta-lactamase superfamily II metal-dependent hydrolase